MPYGPRARLDPQELALFFFIFMVTTEIYTEPWGLCAALGQFITETKSNEITAIPALLDVLDIRGAVVSIDAMGCQKSIASRIVDCGADYLLALKDNHPTAHQKVVACVADAVGTTTVHSHTDTDSRHGRVEVRRVHDTTDDAWFEERAA